MVKIKYAQSTTQRITSLTLSKSINPQYFLQNRPHLTAINVREFIHQMPESESTHLAADSLEHQRHYTADN
jgi:hypothetical protein